MSELLTKTALQLADMMAAGEITSVELTRASLDRIKAHNPTINAFLHVDEEGALATAREVDEKRAAGENLGRLAGIPIAIKDNLVIRGMPTTCGSKMLEGWLPPYDATVITKIKNAGMPIVGKTNMDEFAMGSSTEFSAYGSTKNPWDTERIPGGSGGGSAAAVSAFMVPLALGSDTGGSIRQPGSVTGTVGVKPTYGAVSRYGLIAMASSLDQVGPVARTVADAAALQEVISGHDELDSTSLDVEVPAFEDIVAQVGADRVKGLKIGIVEQLSADGFEPGVEAEFEATVKRLEDAGAEVVNVSLPSFEYALSAYYLIMPAEVSSNMARFDGMRFGLRAEPETGPVTAERVMAESRGQGFGAEVKRRIILGTHVLSSGNYDAYYGAAQKVRTLVQRDLDEAFSKVDVLVTPTAPTTAFKFGEKIDDPMAMYLNDLATIPANLAGTPGLSVPCGLSEGMPVGFQILAPAYRDDLMYEVAAAVEASAGEIAGSCPAKEWENN
ncbi:Asp-tRNA(Asn)/Glu-tRNA(Gln) amidotransferase subunit GatA [Flaviflexus ciconiae]|uniref:Glutamyl-tRNA(Gln) amidotransferase subunit A n=1 Tax=Flaviflexus ciconiae TaxID=2496867 RepID=A0A3S9PXH0_9ACTO|nr:Asp-tRNA(Asn)/Glu-tRNA(Gln) amidotransferase subunit GatA [Flaviflexus ciconiae]AZQ77049.1 Asp-tRNA(Asn)/Glu-tRNA(Gln) amidotransferase subunit GatA [Flaviflexus ciconiae]